MKKKYLIITFLILVFLPVLYFAQGGTTTQSTTTNYEQLLKFLTGDGAFEQWFMQVFTTLDTSIANNAVGATLLGRAIGGFGVLISLGYMGWQMQAGDREWEIMPMIKPFLIGLILFEWSGFVGLIQAPFRYISTPSMTVFTQIEENANDLRIKCFEKQTQLLEALIKKKAEEEVKQDKIDEAKEKSVSDYLDFSEEMDNLMQPIKEWQLRMDFKLQKLLADFVESIGLSILRICVYFIFFIQKIWSYILIVLGPIAIGMALIPGFENSLYSWVSKFININLYTFVSYTIINIGQQLIMSAYTMEISRYDELISSSGQITDLNLLLAYVDNNGMLHTVAFSVVAYIITGIGVLMTPTIADAIVSAGGAGVMSKIKQNAGRVASAGKTAGSIAGGAASGGATAVATAVKEISKAVNTMKTK